MRYLMELQRPVPTDKAGGEPSIQWQAVKRLYVSLDPQASAESFLGGQTEASTKWKMMAHVDADIQVNRRFVLVGTERVFDITAVLADTKGIGAFVTIDAVERQR